jgi:hypothetical protein
VWKQHGFGARRGQRLLLEALNPDPYTCDVWEVIMVAVRGVEEEEVVVVVEVPA